MGTFDASPPRVGTSGRPATLRQQQKDVTHARFLEAALKVFEERGFQAATVDRIATEAGASRATFYLHFKSKADVIRALLEPITPALRTLAEKLDTVLTGSSRADLRGWVAEAMEWFATHRTVIMVLEQARLGARGEVPSVRLRPYTEYLPRYSQTWPKDRQAEANLRLLLAISLLVRVNTLEPSDRERLELDEDALTDILTDLFESALKTA